MKAGTPDGDGGVVGKSEEAHRSQFGTGETVVNQT